MPKDFKFSGAGPEPNAVSQAISSAVSASSAAAGIQASAYSDVSRMLTQGFQAAQERKQQEILAAKQREMNLQMQASEFGQQQAMQQSSQAFQAQQAAVARAQDAQQFQENLSFGKEHARLQLMGGLGQAGIQEGLDPRPLMNLMMQAATKSLGLGAMPGVPGGYMIDPQQEGYQKLMGEGAGGGFSGVPFTPRQNEAQAKRVDENAIARAEMDIRKFQMSSKGKKELSAPVETTLAEVMGWGSLDKHELEQVLKSEFAHLVPTKDFEGKEEDRSALDAKLEQFTKPISIDVPNGQNLVEMMGAAVGKYEPRVLHEAMDRVYGGDPWVKSNGRLPMTPDEAKSYAFEELRRRYPEATKTHPVSVGVQAPSMSALLNGLQGEALAAPLGSGVGGPIPISKESLASLGLNPGNLGRSMQAAMAFPGYSLVLDSKGRMVVEEKPGQPKDQSLQVEVDALFNNPDRPELYQAVRAGAELDPAVNRSPSEMKDAGTLRGVKTKSKAAPAQPTAPKAAPQTPGSAAISAWRSRQKPKFNTAIPPDLSMIGLSPGKLMKLIGGRRP